MAELKDAEVESTDAELIEIVIERVLANQRNCACIENENALRALVAAAAELRARDAKPKKETT